MMTDPNQPLPDDGKNPDSIDYNPDELDTTTDPDGVNRGGDSVGGTRGVNRGGDAVESDPSGVNRGGDALPTTDM